MAGTTAKARSASRPHAYGRKLPPGQPTGLKRTRYTIDQFTYPAGSYVWQVEIDRKRQDAGASSPRSTLGTSEPMIVEGQSRRTRAGTGKPCSSPQSTPRVGAMRRFDETSQAPRGGPPISKSTTGHPCTIIRWAARCGEAGARLATELLSAPDGSATGTRHAGHAGSALAAPQSTLITRRQNSTNRLPAPAR